MNKICRLCGEEIIDGIDIPESGDAGTMEADWDMHSACYAQHKHGTKIALRFSKKIRREFITEKLMREAQEQGETPEKKENNNV